jgi:hypothetical protein
MIFLITPPDGAVIGFITFIASTISRVSPAFTASPTATNGAAEGSGDRNAADLDPPFAVRDLDLGQRIIG